MYHLFKVEDIGTHSVCQLPTIGTQGCIFLDWCPLCVCPILTKQNVCATI